MFYNLTKEELAHVQSKISKIKKVLEKMPAGYLNWNKNNKYFKYFHCFDNKSTLLKKSDAVFLRQLAIKAVYEKWLEQLEQEEKALQEYLKVGCDERFELNFVKQNPGLEKILKDDLHAKDQLILQWENANFPSSAGYKEALVHKTMKGHMVRSKSEMLIADNLFFSKIPYRYEWDWPLKVGVACADFTLLNPETLIFIPWEHFGMMDVDAYADRAMKKIQMYMNSGFVPDVNLILTFETSNKPITTADIKSVIQKFEIMSTVLDSKMFYGKLL